MSYRIEKVKPKIIRGTQRVIVHEIGDVSLGDARKEFRDWTGKHGGPSQFRLVNAKDAIVEKGGR